MAIEYVCEVCGSTNVTSDAIAGWDTERQDWKIVGHYDSRECRDCEQERDLIERDMALPPQPA